MGSRLALGGAGGVGLTLFSTALAALGAPDAVWIVMLAVGLVLTVGATYFWLRPGALAKQLDELIHEGMNLLGTVSEASLRGEVPYPLVPGAERTEPVAEFAARAHDLVRENRPSLLPVFAEAVNAELRKEREKLPPIGEDQPDGVKLEQFAKRTHARPRIFLQGILNGLAAVRNRLGDQ